LLSEKQHAAVGHVAQGLPAAGLQVAQGLLGARADGGADVALALPLGVDTLVMRVRRSSPPAFCSVMRLQLPGHGLHALRGLLGLAGDDLAFALGHGQGAAGSSSARGGPRRWPPRR
jgi:hypothetical protein